MNLVVGEAQHTVLQSPLGNGQLFRMLYSRSLPPPPPLSRHTHNTLTHNIPLLCLKNQISLVSFPGPLLFKGAHLQTLTYLLQICPERRIASLSADSSSWELEYLKVQLYDLILPAGRIQKVHL